MSFQVRFWMDFWPKSEPRQGVKLFDFRSLFGSWGRLGAKMAPRALQEAPRDRFLGDFGLQLGGFGTPTWWIFDPTMDGWMD